MTPRSCVILLAVLLLALVGGAIAFAADRSPASNVSSSAVAFTTVSVVIDSHDHPLAAYQFEFDAGNAGVQLVGLEGGEGIFAETPYYDPTAMMRHRVIVAAYSTADSDRLPVGPTRVAVLHLRTPAGWSPNSHDIRLVTAGDPEGRPFAADIRLVKGPVR